MKIPKIPKIGPGWFRAWAKELTDYTVANVPIAGIGTLITETPRGRLVDVVTGGIGGSSTAPKPWDPTVSGTSLTLYPGSINSFLPSNMFSTFTIAASGLYYAKLVCNSDGKVLTSVSLQVDTSSPAAQTPLNSALPATLEVVVALVSNGTGYNVWQKSLTAVGSRLFLADKAAPAGPGEMAFVEWLVWSVS